MSKITEDLCEIDKVITELSNFDLKPIFHVVFPELKKLFVVVKVMEMERNFTFVFIVLFQKIIMRYSHLLVMMLLCLFVLNWLIRSWPLLQ